MWSCAFSHGLLQVAAVHSEASPVVSYCRQTNQLQVSTNSCCTACVSDNLRHVYSWIVSNLRSQAPACRTFSTQLAPCPTCRGGQPSDSHRPPHRRQKQAGQRKSKVSGRAPGLVKCIRCFAFSLQHSPSFAPHTFVAFEVAAKRFSGSSL